MTEAEIEAEKRIDKAFEFNRSSTKIMTLRDGYRYF
jgi:hypothetical protein